MAMYDETMTIDSSRPMHKAANKVDGRMSALCYERPRPIPAPETWTLTDDFVTCEHCRRLLAR